MSSGLYLLQVDAGLDIGYVPAGPHAFFRSSGQFGPQQFILCWPAGPVAFRSVENACTSFFLLTCAASDIFFRGTHNVRNNFGSIFNYIF